MECTDNADTPQVFQLDFELPSCAVYNLLLLQQMQAQLQLGTSRRLVGPARGTWNVSLMVEDHRPRWTQRESRLLLQCPIEFLVDESKESCKGEGREALQFDVSWWLRAFGRFQLLAIVTLVHQLRSRQVRRAKGVTISTISSLEVRGGEGAQLVHPQGSDFTSAASPLPSR